MAYTRIVGSNPTVSARIEEKSHRKVAFFLLAQQARKAAAFFSSFGRRPEPRFV